MADWAAALAQGVGAAAASGAQSIGDDIKNQQQLQQQQQLEQQAADIKFDLSQRMNAADQMMKNAALQRYAAVVKDKMSEQVPVSAPSVQATGLTAASVEAAKNGTLPASASASDDDDEDSATPAATPGAAPAAAPGAASTAPYTNFTGDAKKINTLLQEAQRRLADPNRPAELKADDQAVIDGIQAQIKAQQGINASAVSGKMRGRTLEEAADAAAEYTLQNDPEAYVAGTTAYNNANRDDMAQKRLDQQGRLAQAAGDRQLEIERMREQGRVDAIMAKLGPDGAGGGGKAQANVAQVEYLMNKRGLSQDQALNLVYGDGQGLRTDPAKMFNTAVQSLLNNPSFRVDPKVDPPGTTLQQKAIAQAKQIVEASLGMRGTGTGMLDSPGSVPNPLGIGPGGAGGGSAQDPNNPLGLNLPGQQGK